MNDVVARGTVVWNEGFRRPVESRGEELLLEEEPTCADREMTWGMESNSLSTHAGRRWWTRLSKGQGSKGSTLGAKTGGKMSRNTDQTPSLDFMETDDVTTTLSQR